MPWLTPGVIADLRAGDGNEFGRDERPGKIAALHSSSALGVNVFAYWVARSPVPLAQAFGLPDIASIRFERKFPTGVGPRAPNLDVVLKSSSGEIIAIESKFEEPFRRSKRLGLQHAYFPEGRSLWDELGMPGAQRIAESLRSGNRFRYLDAPQLLKHLLGLGRRGGEWSLVLLWYAPPTQGTDEMQAEIDSFTSELGEAQRFSALTYQRLWHRLEPTLGPEHGEYRNYLAARYFPPLSA